MYKGNTINELENNTNSSLIHIIPVSEVLDIPGVSKLGKYNYDTGEIKVSVRLTTP